LGSGSVLPSYVLSPREELWKRMSLPVSEIPSWTVQYAVRIGLDGTPEEIALQLYHTWPNGLTDELTYHSHLRESGSKERNEHYHVNLRVLSKLDMSTYGLITSEVERCRSDLRGEKDSLKLFLRDGEWRRELDYVSFPTPQIEHRIGAYKGHFGASIEGCLAVLRCETVPFGDLASIIDWECLLAERDKRKEVSP
jgi:hypothetical protein